MNNNISHISLPVFINKHGGSADSVIEALQSASNITVHALAPDDLYGAIEKAVDKGLPRIVVSGGDGTLAMAAGLLADSNTEMAIIPGGTLNHFAKRLNIPLDIKEALQLALTGQAKPTHFGMVNEQLFLNTSSVGAYVSFVQNREKLERNLPYMLASFMAAIRRLINFRRVNVHINGSQILTPLVFIGVGERQLKLPDLGQNMIDGKKGLHLIVLRCADRYTALNVAIQAMFRGVNPLASEQQLDNHILDLVEVKVRSRKKWLTVALDGELVKLKSPLRYQFYHHGLNVVSPTEKDSES
ncbi:diacylglycerol kinase family protein [Methylophaga sp.]|uniref:diacylglycerol/lipid kinase family protein n=1 Tax=Methylophaga sp. TaxID=2024840 RepID=UPI00271E90CE|nr:diacylglycerol kinase family protein [Methylophaga sp.]MDO8826128.1 diacylglycerol kinase family protein [Methylophaga sp.]